MTLYVYCTADGCGYSTTWGGGTAADDPAVEHAKDTGHTVKTTVAERPDLAGGEA